MKLRANVGKLRAVKNKMPLIPQRPGLAQSAAAEMPGGGWSCKPILFNGQSMRPHAELHQQPQSRNGQEMGKKKMFGRLSVVISNSAQLGFWLIIWHREHEISSNTVLSGSSGSPKGPSQAPKSLGAPPSLFERPQNGVLIQVLFRNPIAESANRGVNSS